VSKAVLDASAILAILNREPGAEKLTLEVLNEAVSSIVNLAEVQTCLVNKGGVPDEAWEDALGTICEAIPFTEEQAKTAGGLVARTRALGLSLGDRSCLALGMMLDAPVYTTDRAWRKLKLGICIHVLR
jgi:PIN domain nuclease of toxin-antitoxin system